MHEYLQQNMITINMRIRTAPKMMDMDNTTENKIVNKIVGS